MNKYQILKYAIIGLTKISRASSAASFLKPELRVFTQYAEPAKQALIQVGNAYWNYEVSQQRPSHLSFQDTAEGVLINYGI
ncbi:MAG: hypothetical protein MRECE_2c148 [Mycoplasmataceae bacterium CE_OT135]|nr:MAG: hypothetical protein MRECE_2c148 [Mycoplasmataceae bacterium CE_OT135]